MGLIEICGLSVDFPFEPYDAQVSYMEKVILSLQNKQHALLESPTGTGKTLCLLCATLAWQKDAQLKYKAAKSAMKGMIKKTELDKVPVIIYASRTHSQLQQVVQELKATSYRPRMTTLASREQLCVHEKVSKAKGVLQGLQCHQTSHRCKYKNGYSKLTSSQVKTTASEILDIEELVSKMQKLDICPFYTSREMKVSAELIFLPYNYLIDPRYREMISLSCQNAILIFDEAHNVESVAEDAASMVITTTDLAGCIEDVAKLIESTSNSEVVNNGMLLRFKAMLVAMEAKLMSFHIPPEVGLTKPGDYIYTFFEEYNINFETSHLLVSLVSTCLKAQSSDIEGDSSQQHHVSRLETFLNFLQTLFDPSKRRDVALEQTKNYRIFIKEERVVVVPGNNVNNNRRKSFTKSPSVVRSLHYWCLSPAVAMKNIESQGVHNIILTSGTLSPLVSTACELGLAFPIRLENSHVIKPSQVWAGILTVGCSGRKLNSSYRHRTDYRTEYYNELGNTILNISRSVPNGMLVFFPSYSVMETCVEIWKSQSQIFESISRLKQIFVEPRGATAFKPVVKAYENSIKTDPNGSMFFAVCRGKASEGIDFSNANGRAVVITGIPFASTKEARVILKQSHLDSQKGKGGGLSGRTWYLQQANRAVNQAIGRVIRHRNDYGAIILCDERFANVQDGLSKWIQPHVKSSFTSFGEAHKSLVAFYKTNELDYPTTVIPGKALEFPDFKKNAKRKTAAFSTATRVVVSESSSQGQTYVNPSLLSRPAEKQLNTTNDNVLREVAYRRNTKNASVKKELSLEDALAKSKQRVVIENNGTQQQRSATSVYKKAAPVSLTSKYAAETSFTGATSSQQKRATKTNFGLSKKVISSASNSRSLIEKARTLLSEKQVSTLYRAIKQMRGDDEPYEAIRVICQLMKTSKSCQQNLLPTFSSFVTPSQLRIFNKTLKQEGISATLVRNQNTMVKALGARARAKGKLLDAKRREDANAARYAGTVANAQCLICLDNNPTRPHASPCGHICCLGCWKKLVKGTIMSCPMCKKECILSDLMELKTRL